MCTTCGCGNPDEVLIAKPKETKIAPIVSMHHHENQHHHNLDGSHHHPHEQSHTHGDVITLEKDILSRNDLMAQRNRGYFEAKKIVAINLVSSPGSGKTSLLERTLTDLKEKYSFYVIEGDQQTMNDAERIDKTEVPVIQINTGQGCHLDSNMIHRATEQLAPVDNSLVFIENVGNLVCPALFDLGESLRVVIISVTEGDDKPIKYPDMFASAGLCIINKTDLLPYVDFDVKKAKDYALRVNRHLHFIELSARTGEGMEKWYKTLESLQNNGTTR